MRAIGELFAVAAVVVILGFGQRPELLAGGALLLVAIAIMIARADRRLASAPQSRPTVEVIPLEPPRDLADDLEGVTVPAPMTAEAAIELHHRYADAFDRQLARGRRTMRYDAPKPPRFPRGSESHMPRRLEPSPSGWDPHKPPSVTGMRRVK